MVKYLITIIILALLIVLLELKKARDKHKEELDNKHKAKKKKELLDKLADLKSQAEFNDLWAKDKLINEYSYELHMSRINKEIDEVEEEIKKL